MSKRSNPSFVLESDARLKSMKEAVTNMRRARESGASKRTRDPTDSRKRGSFMEERAVASKRARDPAQYDPRKRGYFVEESTLVLIADDDDLSEMFGGMRMDASEIEIFVSGLEDIVSIWEKRMIELESLDDEAMLLMIQHIAYQVSEGLGICNELEKMASMVQMAGGVGMRLQSIRRRFENIQWAIQPISETEISAQEGKTDRVKVGKALHYFGVHGAGDIAKKTRLDAATKAYRQIAMENHPDRNGGDAEKSAKFKHASEQLAILQSHRALTGSAQ